MEFTQPSLENLAGKKVKNKYWQSKVVLVTGYEGFLGSHLTKQLLSLGSKVIGLDIKTLRKTTILDKADLAKITIIKGSVTNYLLLRKILAKYQPEVVFHLAAEATVGSCLNKPLKAFSSNIEGTWKLLEACRQNPNLKSVVLASSDKAYGTKDKLPYYESDSLQGSHPYDVSKSCADLIARTYFETYNLPVSIVRCGNIYGPGDFNFSRLVPDAVLATIIDRPFLIRSSGQFTRDYIYVDDIVRGYLTLAEKMPNSKLSGQAFNFGAGKPISVIKLVEAIYSLSKKNPNYKILSEAKDEIQNQYLSTKKVQKLLGWKARVPLNAGLKKTIIWYQNRLGL